MAGRGNSPGYYPAQTQGPQPASQPLSQNQPPQFFTPPAGQKATSSNGPYQPNTASTSLQQASNMSQPISQGLPHPPTNVNGIPAQALPQPAQFPVTSSPALNQAQAFQGPRPTSPFPSLHQTSVMNGPVPPGQQPSLGPGLPPPSVRQGPPLGVQGYPPRFGPPPPGNVGPTLPGTVMPSGNVAPLPPGMRMGPPLPGNVGPSPPGSVRPPPLGAGQVQPSVQLPPSGSLGKLPPPSQFLPPGGIVSPLPKSPVAGGSGSGDTSQGRPSELPVPFNGQGQYSHQVNPLQQKTPVATPNNSEPPSERSSRGPSPVSGSTIDALEGQFSPGSGPAAFPGTRSSPLPGQDFRSPFSSTPPIRSGPAPSQFGQSAPSSGFPPGSSPVPAPFQQPSQQFDPRYSAYNQGQRAAVQPPPSISGQPGAAPLGVPSMTAGFPPPPASGLPPRPPFTSAMSGPLPPPGSGPGMLPPQGIGSRGPPPPTSAYSPLPQAGSGFNVQGSYPSPQPGLQQTGVGALSQGFGQMGIQDTQRVINLLNEKQVIPPEGLETARPVLPNDVRKVNCSPDIFRCTLNALPQNSALLNKARLPLGILIHPFRDLSQLPVIQSSVIVRCRSCRTYINPFVVFVDQRRWKCNLCYRVNDLPDEFSFDPVTKTYGDPQRRPEVKSATIEFIAPSEYMLRPPQPAVYLFLLDVSFNAVETGYLSQFSQILLDELDKLPGDARTSIGFLCYDSTLYYFNMAEGLSQPQMLCVPDLEDAFLPCPDNLLVNLHESRELIMDLLNHLPTLFQGNLDTGSALGAALQSAHKLMSPTGGRITVMQTCLPTVGPGALQNRDAGQSNTSNIGPATDFFKKLSLDCSAQQIAVDLFMLNGQYSDIATLSCISKYSAGCVYYYPSFHTVKTPGLVDKYDSDFRRYLTRKIGFESVMRIRCTRGLSIHTFHGNFFVRSTDLLSLPNINPDAGFGMQMSIEDNLVEAGTVSFQAALLYTSSKGERRIRVHTLCVPVTNQLSDVFAGADQQAIVALLAKMAVDRSLNSALTDARDAMMNAALDALMAYSQQVPASQRVGTLLAPYSLRAMPLFLLAMLKHLAFNLASNLKTDDRVFAMLQCKVLPVCYLLQNIYPHLYPLHRLDIQKPTTQSGKEEVPSAPLLQLSSANIDRTGLFLMDTGEAMYLLVGSSIGDDLCQDVFDQPNVMSIPDGLMDLPELENPTSERIRSFVNLLMDSRPQGVTFMVVRDDGKYRHLFFQHMLEDRTENSMSYYEFLQFLLGKAKG